MLKKFVTDRPDLRQDWFGFVDGGGTNTRVGIGEVATGTQVFMKKFSSGDFECLEDIIETAFTEANGIPQTIIYALAGPSDKEHGRVRMTNRREWPIFSLSEMEKHTGSHGRLFNDAELLAAGASKTMADKLTALRPGRPWHNGRVMALTWSTGLNGALYENGRTAGLETGYGMHIPPVTDDELSFSKYIARKLKVPFACAEELLGGVHGQWHAPDWLMSLGEVPSAATKARFEKLRDDGQRSYGPALTAGMKDDPFCRRIMRVIGGLYGTYLRQLLVEFMPTGGLHLAGSVNITTVELLADPEYSPLLARLSEHNLPYADRVDILPVYLNRDGELMKNGAHILAAE